MTEPHEVLGVAPGADETALRAAYRDLLKQHHPDHGGSVERFLRIKDAYEEATRRGSGGITEPLSDGGRTVTATRERVEATGRAVQGEDGLELAADADGLVVRLTALTDRLQTESMLPNHVERGRRLGACFHVANETGQSVTWQARSLRFVGSQGERYLPSVYRPKRQLPDRWRGDDVELAPGETARSFLLSRALPEHVAVDAVVYDQRSSAAGPARRVTFDLDRSARTALDRAPFQ